MFKKNTGSNEQDILQNQFTSYLSFAVSNARIDFIRAKIARLKREQVTDQYEILLTQEVMEVEAIFENEALTQAIKDIRKKRGTYFLPGCWMIRSSKRLQKNLEWARKA